MWLLENCKLHICCCCSVAKSWSTLSDPMDCSTPGFPVLHYLLEFAQTHVHLVKDAIQPSHPLPPLLLLPSVFPSIRVFSNELALRISGQSTGASSASASVLPMMNIQDWFPLGLTVWFPCKNTQESTPAPQLKSINSLVLSLLYGPALTSVHDYWENHVFDY